MKIFNFFSKFLKLFNFLHKQTIQEPKVQEPVVIQKKEPLLHFIFVTRCYKITNLRTIKENLKSVFSNQDDYTYEQILIADLSYNTPIYSFKALEDQNTSVFFVKDKGKDKYMSKGIDDALKDVNKDKAFVYVLDDDNLISQKFLDICKDIDYETDDVVFFNVKGKSWKFDRANVKVVGTVDWSSFVTKLTIMKQLKVQTEPWHSVKCDALFISKVRTTWKRTKVLELEVGNYNVLPKP